MNAHKIPKTIAEELLCYIFKKSNQNDFFISTADLDDFKYEYNLNDDDIDRLYFHLFDENYLEENDRYEFNLSFNGMNWLASLECIDKYFRVTRTGVILELI